MATITGATSTTNNTAEQQRVKKSNDELGKDEFLNLLITQLRYQDPMNPMEDKEFISQMAQFSSLEQMQNMSTALLSTQASSMIGKAVTWTDSDGYVQSGVVKAVKIVDGQPKLSMVESLVEVSKITSGVPTDLNTLVGTTVKWTDAYGREQSGTVVSVGKLDGKDTVAIESQTIEVSQVSSIQNAS
jgi:flagellar basal-body rod modification protein FlgD